MISGDLTLIQPSIVVGRKCCHDSFLTSQKVRATAESAKMLQNKLTGTTLLLSIDSQIN
jgi:hypothetical protein